MENLILFSPEIQWKAKMMQFLDDNYQFTHEKVQMFLGIKTVRGDKTAERLQKSCFLGNSDAIKEMIEEGVDMSMHDDMAIKTAADCNHTNIVKDLFKLGYKSDDVIEYILKTTAPIRENFDLIMFAKEIKRRRKLNRKKRKKRIKSRKGVRSYF